MTGGPGPRATAALAPLVALLLAGCGGGHPVEMIHGAGPPSAPGSLAVRADLPSGKLEVSAGSPGALYDLSLSYCRDHFRPLSRFEEDGSRSGVPGASLLEIAALWRGEARGEEAGEEPNLLTLLLRPGVPLDLRLSVGRGSMDLDLTALGIDRLALHGGSGPATVSFQAGNSRDLEQFRFVAGEGPVKLEGLGWGRVTSLEFHGGAGEATLDWSGPGPAEAAAFLDPGTGPLSLSFPADLGVVLTGKGLRPGAGFAGFVEQGGVWLSDNRGRAARRLTLVLDPGPGEIRFAWKP
jgi:hypothetical protein